MRRSGFVGVLLTLLVATGCSGDSEDENGGLAVPDGVKLTEAGNVLDVGESATVAYPDDSEDATALTVTVQEIEKGDIADFALFSLNDEDAKSTPYYVRLQVVNEGPGTPGSASLLVFARPDGRTLLTPNSIVGTFDQCPSSPIPEDLKAGDSAEQCLVYLVGEHGSLESVDLQPGEEADSIRWKVPAE